MGTSDLHKLTRKELYDKVWATPGVKLAEEFGVSDVAIAKRCRKLSVPRPSPGYWAKVAAGKRPSRPSLPPPPIDVFAKSIQRSVRRDLHMPAEPSELNSVAAEFLKAVQKGKPDDEKRVRVCDRTLPEGRISKAMAWRAAQTVHVLIEELEKRGLPFRRARSSYEGGYFEKWYDRLYFSVEEELVTKPVRSTKRLGFYRNSSENRVPGGSLVFELKKSRYGSSEEGRWTDDGKKSQLTMLRKMVRFVCDHYLDLKRKRDAEAIEQEKRRIEQEIHWKKWQEEEAIRKQREAERQHAESLEAAKQHREADLVTAAQSWRHHLTVTEFIAECERRWRESHAGESTEEQSKWLLWAREKARALSPFEAGYPDPQIDGAFDPAAVPFGGPYPPTRRFPRPRTSETAPVKPLAP